MGRTSPRGWVRLWGSGPRGSGARDSRCNRIAGPGIQLGQRRQPRHPLRRPVMRNLKPFLAATLLVTGPVTIAGAQNAPPPPPPPGRRVMRTLNPSLAAPLLVTGAVPIAGAQTPPPADSARRPEVL